MSSIYKKGRDGYFYYQTYIYNPANKKKDKKIFHSLGTKDLNEAQIKKEVLDLKYQKISHGGTKFFSRIYSIVNKTSIFLIPVGAITILFFIFFQNKDQNQKNSISKTIFLDEVGSETSILSSMKNIEEIPPKKVNLKEVKIKLPEYNVLRIEKISGNFNQGKIYATIEGEVNKATLQLLCKHFVTKHPEFSNIIICLYRNSKIGKKIALSKNQNFSNKELIASWLAMYTYNAVEGEYFDNNPVGYFRNK